MKLARGIIFDIVGEEGYIYSPKSNEIFSVNPLGVEVLSNLGKDQKELTKFLALRYNQDESLVERDIKEFINELVAKSIVSTSKID